MALKTCFVRVDGRRLPACGYLHGFTFLHACLALFVFSICVAVYVTGSETMGSGFGSFVPALLLLRQPLLFS